MNRVGRPISFSPKSNAAKTEREAMEEWSFEASVRIKRAMRKRDWGYKELSEALKGLGVKRSPTAINRRINRGNFSAGLFLACLYVLEDGADEVAKANTIAITVPASNEPSP